MDVHNGGRVELIDTMPSVQSSRGPLGIEAAIVQCARVSVGNLAEPVKDDAKLIGYLFRHEHTSPFEHVKFKFRIKCPIFVARQILRHRTANVNEWSQRYALADTTEFFSPLSSAQGFQGVRMGGSINKQSSVPVNEVDEKVVTLLQKIDGTLKDLRGDYEELLQLGVAREVARYCLPLATYTTFYFTMDLHNLLRFLRLRLDPTAQKETRDYVEAMYNLILPLVPITLGVFENYTLRSIRLSQIEIQAIQAKMLELPSKSEEECRDYKRKLSDLGI